MVPRKEGFYHIILRGVMHGDDEIMVLPWISDVIEVCSEDKVLGFTPRMLTCFRYFDIEEYGMLRFREEYGAGMGTHIYDSAVVLMRFLRGLRMAGQGGQGKKRRFGIGAR